MQTKIKSMIKESIGTKQLVHDRLAPAIENATNMIIKALRNGNKLLIAGNGGSASQASHIAAEFVGRFKIERRALPCIALNTDTSILTAWSNDYSYDAVFSRQIEALANEGDVFIALSTSGNSRNLIGAIDAAKKAKVKVISLLGKDGGKMKDISDIEIVVPSDNTPRIQEAHIMVMHIMCEIIDEKLFLK